MDYKGRKWNIFYIRITVESPAVSNHPICEDFVVNYRGGGGGRRGGLFMRGSIGKALPGKVLVFCIGGCSREVVAYLRISHVGVQ